MSFDKSVANEYKASLLSNQHSQPLELTKIEVSGADLQDSFCKKLLSNLLSDKYVSITELNRELGRVEKNLKRTGLFEDIDIVIDSEGVAGKTVLKGEPQLGPNHINLPTVIRIKLKEHACSNYSSLANSTEDYLGFGLKYQDANFLKNASNMLVDIKVNYDPIRNVWNDKKWDFRLSVPVPNNTSLKTVFNPSISFLDKQKFSSHDFISTGGFFGIEKSVCVSKLTSGIQLTNRRITNVANSAADSIRTDAGDDIKVSFRTNFKVDSRKFVDRFPVSGVLTDLDLEWSGFNNIDHESQSAARTGSNANDMNTFVKSQFNWQSNKSMLNNLLTSQLSFSVGSIFAASTNKTPVHIADKFFLGGLNSLKGFHTNSVGLIDGNDYIGGTSFFKLGLSTFSTLPNTSPASPLRVYNFINCGDVVDSLTLSTLKSPAIASGIGLVYKSESAQFDLMYAIPLSSRAQDNAKPGLSFGLSLNFF